MVASGETLSGRDAIHANIATLMSAVSDAALSVNRAFATSDAGAIDWTFICHYSRQRPGFPPAVEQAFSFRATTLFELEDDLVVRTTEFYDLYGLFVQLGLLASAAESANATPSG